MSKTVRQYRYFGNGHSSNSPSGITKQNLTSGSIFFSEPSLGAIIQLGIQALPGTKFYLNHGTSPVIVGYTGLYQLELNKNVAITALSFNEGSLSLIGSSNNPEAHLIIDAIYEVEE